MSSAWVASVYPKPTYKCLSKRQRSASMAGKDGKTHEDADSDVTAGNTEDHQRWEKQGGILSLSLQRSQGPADTLILDF